MNPTQHTFSANFFYTRIYATDFNDKQGIRLHGWVSRLMLQLFHELFGTEIKFTSFKDEKHTRVWYVNAESLEKWKSQPISVAQVPVLATKNLVDQVKVSYPPLPSKPKTHEDPIAAVVSPAKSPALPSKPTIPANPIVPVTPPAKPAESSDTFSTLLQQKKYEEARNFVKIRANPHLHAYLESIIVNHEENDRAIELVKQAKFAEALTIIQNLLLSNRPLWVSKSEALELLIDAGQIELLLPLLEKLPTGYGKDALLSKAINKAIDMELNQVLAILLQQPFYFPYNKDTVIEKALKLAIDQKSDKSVAILVDQPFHSVYKKDDLLEKAIYQAINKKLSQSVISIANQAFHFPYRKDTMLENAFNRLMENRSSFDPVDYFGIVAALLNQQFHMPYRRKALVEKFARSLGLRTEYQEDRNRLAIGKHLSSLGHEAAAAQIALAEA